MELPHCRLSSTQICVNFKNKCNYEFLFRYSLPKSSSASQMPTSTASHWSEANGVYGFTKQQSMPALRPPAYRPPPPGPSVGRNSSPAEPPPYREPPPPESSRYRGPSPSRSSQYPVRPPHYSPPPTHRTPHLGRHPSRGSLIGAPRNYQQQQPHGLPYRQQQMPPYPSYQVC